MNPKPENSCICRLCGTNDGIRVNIFDPKGSFICKIRELLPIMIHEQDPWPKLICHRCAFKLQEFYDFRELCVRTDCKLKRGGSLSVPNKPWTQQQAPTSWMQITPPSSSPAPSLPSQVAVVNIKQEKPDEAGPPMLVPQKPLLQQSPMMQPTQMVHHSPQLMQQQSYESLMQQQQQQQQSQIQQQTIIQQQQPQMAPVIQQQGLMQQQQFIARMPVLSHSPHLLMQTHPPTTSSSPQQAPQQISSMPMVQFSQGNFRIKQQPNDTLQNTSPRTGSFVKRRISRPNAVFLSSNQDESYLSEGPDDGILNEGINHADNGPLKDHLIRDSLGRFLPGDNGSGSNKRKTEKTSTAGQITKSSNSKKRKKGGADSGYKRRRSSKSKSKAKPDPKSQTNSKSPANTKNSQQVVPNTDISKPRRKPGPKPKTKISDNPNKNVNKTIEPESINSNQSTTNIKTESSSKKTSNTKIRKAGPKSRVGIRESDADSDHSEVSIVLCKPPNSVLDTIDITQQPDTPQESEEERDPAEALPSHILLTRIPGICDIYTCTICECTITSKKHVLHHVCQTKPSKEVKLSEPNSDETSSDEDDRNKTTMNADRSTAIQEITYKGDSDSGPYACEVCDAVFTRQVTLMSHKEKHLYPDSDEDSDDLVTLNRLKTKKEK